MELTVQNVYGLLLRSNLLTIEEARAMYSRWQDEAGEGSTNLSRFAAWMVANKYVTEYQAALLARGHADGFFIGPYKILDRLGKGRMAGVYHARHKLGQEVAIKVLPPSRARDATMLARFQREAKLSLRLKHPNIVRAFQVGVSDKIHYLVLEHLEGETLEEVLLVRKKLPAAEGVRLVHQALVGLQHIHEQGVVHRDLKPSNLMLVPAPGASTLGSTLKILDIGLGRALYDESAEAPDPNLTGEGVLLGTPDYMAPEQARDARSTDIRADIYSLGCVLYHILTGQPPFPDTNIISQMIRHASETPRPLREFNPALPDGLQQILGWMLAKDPTGRYPTPGRAAQALEVFLAADGASASNPDQDPGMKPYLTWLEKESSPETAVPPGAATQTGKDRPPSSTIPVAEKPRSKPSSATIPVAPPVPASASDRDTHKIKKKKKSAPAPTRPGPPTLPLTEPRSAPLSGELPAHGAVPFIEVERVDLPTQRPQSLRELAGGLTRRDLILFFAGVASGLLAYAIGRGLASLLSTREREPEPEQPRDQPGN